ncbi:MAG: hypothetical protein ACKN9T_00260 [Candidatus Methylumidiphilus sp.]
MASLLFIRTSDRAALSALLAGLRYARVCLHPSVRAFSLTPSACRPPPRLALG